MSELLLTLNAGSSSIKFAVFDAHGESRALRASGQVEGIGGHSLIHIKAGGTRIDEEIGEHADHRAALTRIIGWIESACPGETVRGVGHRVVHGGMHYAAPTVIDTPTLTALRELSPLAPLHQPHNIAGIEAAQAEFPEALQVACFDTAFHRSQPFVSQAFALPRAMFDEGIRRYGFHGLSYEFIALRLREIAPSLAAGRVVVAHLGNGASLCAMRDGRSVASTMGFTALDGMPMGTRCGQIDPGVLLYLMAEKRHDARSLETLLYKNSGLMGLSGVSGDMRELEASSLPHAQEAIAYFAARIRREIASLAAALGGLDALVFTGGIGENSKRIRALALEDMGWIGLRLDPQANDQHGPRITQPDSAVQCFVIRTNEEEMIAAHTWRALQSTPARQAA